MTTMKNCPIAKSSSNVPIDDKMTALKAVLSDICTLSADGLARIFRCPFQALTALFAARYSRLNAKVVYSFLLISVLSASIGVGAHESEASCPMPNLPACCKKALSRHATAVVSMARLCCKLNCSESGPTTSNNSSSVSSQSGLTANSAAMPASITASHSFPRTLTSVADSPFNSHPKYIQHLALLI